VILSTLLFAAAGVFSMVNTVSKPMTVMQVILLVQVMILYYVCLSRALRTEEDVQTALKGVFLSLLLQGIIGCTQFLLQRNFLLFSTGSDSGETIVVGEDSGSFLRVFGTVGKPNGYAMVISPLLLLTIVLFRFKDTPDRRLKGLALFFGTLGLLFSASRGGWLSVTVALLVYFAVAFSQLKHERGRVIRWAAVSLLLVSILGGAVISRRITSDDKNAAGSRVPLVNIAIEMIKAHPLLGIGANTYKNVMYNYVPDDYGAGTYVDQVHNHYLLVTAEMGFLGLAAFAFWMRKLWRVARDGLDWFDESGSGALGLALALILVQASTHMMVEAYISKMALSSLITIVAIVASAKRVNDGLYKTA
jgi:O-antigen ligase